MRGDEKFPSHQLPQKRTHPASEGEGNSHGGSASGGAYPLPAPYRTFLLDNGVDPDVYLAPEPPRYIRTNPRRFDSADPSARTKLEQELGHSLEPVRWLDPPTSPSLSPGAASGSSVWSCLYSLPNSVKIAGSQAYKSGQIYGIDAASAAAVRALECRPGDRVLDICCAPGAKLCMICDEMNLEGLVVGIDLSKHRLAACKTLVKKYGITNADLVEADATTWTPHDDTAQPPTQQQVDTPPAALAEPPESLKFDRVIVDAECTHDGSFKHLSKFQHQWGWETFAKRVLDPVRISTLTSLQQRLLLNGFRLLKQGGVLVYSTCSFCVSQNEAIVESLLKRYPDAARLDPLPFGLEGPPCRTSSADKQPTDDPAEMAPSPAPRCTPSRLTVPARPSLLEADGPAGSDGRHCTARFDPKLSHTGGLFIARLTKTKAIEPLVVLPTHEGTSECVKDEMVIKQEPQDSGPAPPPEAATPVDVHLPIKREGEQADG